MPTVPPPSRLSLVRSFTNRDFTSIREELSSLIIATRPDVWTDFFESNLGLSLIDMLAMVGDIVTLGQDVAALETFLSTCERFESAVRFANSVGYRPQGARAAEVIVELQEFPADVVTNGATIAAGQVITGGNGLSYELLLDQVIPAGATTFEMTLTEGSSFEEEFDAAAEPDFEATVEEENVVEGSWVVYVGDTSDPNNIWREVDNLALESTASKTYETELTPDNKLLIRFGDDIRGQIPNDTITIMYRTCNGGEGNTAIDSISGNFQGIVISTLAVVSLSFRNSSNAAAGGANPESVRDLKANVPAFLRSGDRIISIEDYSNYARQVAGVAQAIAGRFSSAFSANVIEVNVWGSEVVDFTSESPTSGRRSTVSYTRYAVLDPVIIPDLQAFFTPRTIITSTTVFTAREVAYADIYLSEVRYDPRFDPDDVHEALTQAVIDVFEDSGGFIIALSDVYNAIDSIPSVVRFNIDRIVFERLTPTAATGTIGINGTSPEGAFVTISDGVTSVKFEVDSNATLVDPSAIPVDPGADFMEFAVALRDAIQNNLSMTAVIVIDGTGNITIALTNSTLGDVGNVAITTGNGWSLVLNPVTGMSGGSDTATGFLTDYRRDQEPNPDPYPVGPNYVPGEPFVDGGPAWQDDGFLPYVELQDLTFPDISVSQAFYNAVYLYNGELLYNSTGAITTPPQAINLRRLVFELQQDS